MEMTRGEIQDLLVKFATEQPQYKDSLKKNPKEVIYKQFGIQVPGNVKVQVLQETADQVYVVLPHVVESGAELSDADLEKIRQVAKSAALEAITSIEGRDAVSRSVYWWLPYILRGQVPAGAEAQPWAQIVPAAYQALKLYQPGIVHPAPGTSAEA